MTAPVKLRVVKIQMADPIKAEADLPTAVFEDLPLTLRDDEMMMEDGDYDETEVNSHEQDSPIAYDAAGTGTTFTGSFVSATKEQLAELIGGTVTDDVFSRSATRASINKALKLSFKDGTSMTIPNAVGYVRMNLGLGYDGIAKYPFSFKALQADKDWDVDIIW